MKIGALLGVIFVSVFAITIPFFIERQPKPDVQKETSTKKAEPGVVPKGGVQASINPASNDLVEQNKMQNENSHAGLGELAQKNRERDRREELEGKVRAQSELQALAKERAKTEILRKHTAAKASALIDVIEDLEMVDRTSGIAHYSALSTLRQIRADAPLSTAYKLKVDLDFIVGSAEIARRYVGEIIQDRKVFARERWAKIRQSEVDIENTLQILEENERGFFTPSELARRTETSRTNMQSGLNLLVQDVRRYEEKIVALEKIREQLGSFR